MLWFTVYSRIQPAMTDCRAQPLCVRACARSSILGDTRLLVSTPERNCSLVSSTQPDSQSPNQRPGSLLPLHPSSLTRTRTCTRTYMQRNKACPWPNASKFGSKFSCTENILKNLLKETFQGREVRRNKPNVCTELYFCDSGNDPNEIQSFLLFF